MANAFSDFFGAVAGQQKESPYTAIDYNQILQQSITPAAQANISYNQQVAAPYAQLQRQVENIYDPNQAALREATTNSILSQLNLGTALPADLQQQVIQNALQGSASSGFGLSRGGRGLVARDLGLSGLNLLNQRQNAAASFARSAPSVSSLYNPISALSPELFAGASAQMANDAQVRAVEEFQRREGNKIALYNTGGRLLGTAVGAYFGGAAGAQMGGEIGGSLIKNPYRQQSGGGGGGMGGGFSSLLSGLGSMGGGSLGKYSAGPGQTYAGSNGQVMTSTMASPVQNY